MGGCVLFLAGTGSDSYDAPGPGTAAYVSSTQILQLLVMYGSMVTACLCLQVRWVFNKMGFNDRSVP